MAIRAISADGSWENRQVSPARQLPFKKYLEGVRARRRISEAMEGDSLAQRLGRVVAESAVGPCAVSGGKEVLAHNVALLLPNRRSRPEGRTHRLADQIARLAAHGRGCNRGLSVLADHQRKQGGGQVVAIGLEGDLDLVV